MGAPLDAYVTSLHRDDLGHLPGPGSLRFWSGALAAGAGHRNVAVAIDNAPERRQLLARGLVPRMTFRHSSTDAMAAERLASRRQTPLGPLSPAIMPRGPAPSRHPR